MSNTEFSSIPEALDDIRDGRLVVVVDDEDRENEGDLIMAAECVTPEHVNFCATYGRGLICVSLTSDRIDELHLGPMVRDNTAKLGTRFTVSVDSVHGTTTGISAPDRAKTIADLVDSSTQPEDLARPGHVFPIEAVPGGVLVRAGHTEASSDLARLAGFAPSGLLCEIMADDGTMARLPELLTFAKRHNLKLITIRDLIAYRHRNERLVKRTSTVNLPTRYGDFTLHMYHSELDGRDHLALVRGDVAGRENTLVRVHSSCLTGDVLGSLRCDCGSQLEAALRQVAEEDAGVVVYMWQEGRGIGLANKIKAYARQDDGEDTVEANESLGFPADLRDYGLGAQILADLGVSSIRLLTNNPRKIVGLRGYGLQVTERVPLVVPSNPHNTRYLETKQTKLGHLLEPTGS